MLQNFLEEKEKGKIIEIFQWWRVKTMARYCNINRVGSSQLRCSLIKSVFKNFTKFTGQDCARVSFLIKLQASACNFIKKKTLVQVFSCAFLKNFKNTFFTEHLQTTASVELYVYNLSYIHIILRYMHITPIDI